MIFGPIEPKPQRKPKRKRPREWKPKRKTKRCANGRETANGKKSGQEWKRAFGPLLPKMGITRLSSRDSHISFCGLVAAGLLKLDWSGNPLRAPGQDRFALGLCLQNSCSSKSTLCVIFVWDCSALSKPLCLVLQPCSKALALINTLGVVQYSTTVPVV